MERTPSSGEPRGLWHSLRAMPARKRRVVAAFLVVGVLVLVIVGVPVPSGWSGSFAALPCYWLGGLGTGYVAFQLSGPSQVTMAWSTNNGADAYMTILGPGVSEHWLSSEGSVTFNTPGGTFDRMAEAAGDCQSPMVITLSVTQEMTLAERFLAR